MKRPPWAVSSRSGDERQSISAERTGYRYALARDILGQSNAMGLAMIARVRSLFRRRQSRRISDEVDFRRTAVCERLRVDRNGSWLHLLLIDADCDRHRHGDLLERIEHHLSPIDTVGSCADRRVGLLLPAYPHDELALLSKSILRAGQEMGVIVDLQAIEYPAQSIDEVCDLPAGRFCEPARWLEADGSLRTPTGTEQVDHSRLRRRVSALS